ncbi:MAG: hypothetical protein EOP50_20210 [Sphingobacteriales bacterium]|nr:MAG: hypothetical protein EOP50_20210 [Sphingobacteriales bacterium]
MNTLAMLRARLFGLASLLDVIDNNRADLIARREQIGQQLHALNIEKKAVSLKANQAWAEFNAARRAGESIDRRRAQAYRDLGRVNGAAAALKSLRIGTRKSL